MKTRTVSLPDWVLPFAISIVVITLLLIGGLWLRGASPVDPGSQRRDTESPEKVPRPGRSGGGEEVAPPAGDSRPQDATLTDFEGRPVTAGGPDAAREKALEMLKRKIPGVDVQFDPITGSPNHIMATGRFLTTARVPGGDVHAPVRQFVNEYAALFGHDATVLDDSRVIREDVTGGNGMRTVVWQQQVDGVPLYKTILKANLTRDGELVTLGGHFMVDAEAATQMDLRQREALMARPPVDSAKAVSLAAANLGGTVAPEMIVAASQPEGAERKQRFSAALLSDIFAQLSWLPLGEDSARLVWDVTLMSLKRREMFRVVVDAKSGEVWVRTSLTDDISDASYRVYGNGATLQPFDSPSPFSPGLATPGSSQPATVARNLITTQALDTSASPNGWIDDGVTKTFGNNVDAHLDLSNVNPAYGAGTHATSATRSFDFAMDLAQAPSSYKDAAMTQLFYVCNWCHDQMYALGFTETSGNFQQSNFARGGLGNDAVLADAQDGGDTNNANFSTPAEGLPGRMQMYLFTQPSPDRDGSFDAEIVIHEYTHGLSNRLVGGGMGLSAVQSRGMGEGWSDFYPLCLLSQPGDAVSGNYAAGAYATYQLGGLTQNYYYGIRRYPYTTDMTRNPLTLKDMDPTQADGHAGIPRSPIIGSTAYEVHNIGEIWCVTLWDARANLINKLGAAAGNQLILQLVTDGMKLSPVDPTFLQARDAIIQADLVANSGANSNELWAAFAKRGMGAGASVPVSFTTEGVVESYQMPDNLAVSPIAAFSSSGDVGGPFSPASKVYTLTNIGQASLNWTVSADETWLSVSPPSGTLDSGASTTVTVMTATAANSLSVGSHFATTLFTNTASGATISRPALLEVSPLRVVYFDLNTDPGWTRQGEWAFGTPTGGGGSLYGRNDPTSGATGTKVFGINLGGDYSISPGGPQYLTTGTIDLTNCSGTQLRFKRWLNTDYPPYAYATIQVSNDGSNWTSVFANLEYESITDLAWTTVKYDISGVADGHGAVQIRWGHQVAGNFAFPYSGWNIDDVEILATFQTGPPLAVIPATRSVPASGNSYYFTVNANSPWSWTSSAAWLTSGEAPSQSVDGMFAYVVATNTSESSRMADIILTDGVLTVTHTVTQAGALPGEFANVLVQTLDDGTESIWRPYGGDAVVDASLVNPQGLPGFFAGAFNTVGTLDAEIRPDPLGTVTATNVWGNHAVPPQSGTFVAAFTTIPGGDAVDTVVGFSSGPADFWDDLAAYVRFSPLGKVDARNGNAFAAATNFDYTAGVSYLVEMEIDVVTKRYWATVTPAGGAPVLIADNYAFRTEQNSVTQLANFAYLTWTGGTQAVAGLVVPDLATTIATNVWVNHPVPPQSGTFVTSFTTTPGGSAVDTVMGFSSETADFWGDLAAYVRFNPAGKVDARSGNLFAAAENLDYTAGVSYLVEMEINVAAKSYSATVTPAGGLPVRIADNYGFRTEQNAVTQLANFSCLTWTGGTQTVGGLVNPPSVIDLPPLTSPDTSGPLIASATAAETRITKEIRLVPGCHAIDETFIVDNLAGGARRVTLQITDDYGSDGGTVVHMTSSGDQIVGPGDSWFISYQDPEESSIDPVLMVSWCFSGNLPAPLLTQVPAFGDDRLRFNLIATMAGGESATVTLRRQLFESLANALAEGRYLDSSNADLGALTLSAGTLTPVFAAETTDYAASVPNEVSMLTVTPTVAQAIASVTVNGMIVSHGTASDAISLAVGGNMITTEVTARNGTTTKAYLTNVTRTPTDFQAWRQTWFGTFGNTGNAANDHDFDHDGLVNLLEFAFGLNPMLGSSRQTPPGQRVGGNFVISFATPSGVSGITYGAQQSTTMAPADWHAILDSGSGGTHTFSVPVNGDARLFMRLTVASE